MSEGPLIRYRAMVRDGILNADSMQALAAEKLQGLHAALADPGRCGLLGERLLVGLELALAGDASRRMCRRRCEYASQYKPYTQPDPFRCHVKLPYL